VGKHNLMLDSRSLRGSGTNLAKTRKRRYGTFPPTSSTVQLKAIRRQLFGPFLTCSAVVAFTLMQLLQRGDRYDLSTSSSVLVESDNCMDDKCCTLRYPGNPMIGQLAMYDASCPWGTPLDRGIDCIGGDKCRWCCTTPLDPRCANAEFICPTKEKPFKPSPTHLPTTPPTHHPTARKSKAPARAPVPVRSKSQGTASAPVPAPAPVPVPVPAPAPAPAPDQVKSPSSSPPTPTPTASTPPPTPESLKDSQSETPPIQPRLKYKDLKGTRKNAGFIASLIVAIAIIGSLALALGIMCCERHFRQRRVCCCCSLQFSFRHNSSFGSTCMQETCSCCCCKRICMAFWDFEKPGSHISDEHLYAEDDPCQPVTKAVSLGKDMVG